VRVAVEPTNEEWMAARQALATLDGADATMPTSNLAFYYSDERPRPSPP